MKALTGSKIEELNKTAAGQRLIRLAMRNAHETESYAGKIFIARGGKEELERKIKKILEEAAASEEVVL